MWSSETGTSLSLVHFTFLVAVGCTRLSSCSRDRGLKLVGERIASGQITSGGGELRLSYTTNAVQASLQAIGKLLTLTLLPVTRSRRWIFCNIKLERSEERRVGKEC